MSEEFKKKLKDYMEGKLSSKEAEEIEKELEKLEDYQAVLDKFMNKDNGENSTKDKKQRMDLERKVIRRGKWKARFQNAFVALSLILAVSLICGIISAGFYSGGDPSKSTVYNDVLKSAVAVTEPNIRVGTQSTQVGWFFSMKTEGELTKQIGMHSVKAGDIKTSFLFRQSSYSKRTMNLEDITFTTFIYPGSSKENIINNGWERLEKLPEGTVAEAYLSFDKLYTTNEILQKFEHKNLMPVWFAVDNGFSNSDNPYDRPVIGFPYRPLWHYEDFTITSRKEESWGKFGKKISQSSKAPEIEAYGSGDLRDKNFLDTLMLLNRYDKITNRVVKGRNLDLDLLIEYIQNNGVNIYGMVVTGPTKEILKLKNDPFVTVAFTGEARLWDWK